MWRGDQNRSTVTKGEHFYHLLGCQPGPCTTASHLEGCRASTWCRVTPALSPLTASMLCYAKSLRSCPHDLVTNTFVFTFNIINSEENLKEYTKMFLDPRDKFSKLQDQRSAY